MTIVNPYEPSPSVDDHPHTSDSYEQNSAISFRKLRRALLICLIPVLFFTLANCVYCVASIGYYLSDRGPALIDDAEGREEEIRAYNRAADFKIMLTDAICLSFIAMSSAYFAWSLLRYWGMLGLSMKLDVYDSITLTKQQSVCWNAGSTVAILYLLLNLRFSIVFRWFLFSL